MQWVITVQSNLIQTTKFVQNQIPGNKGSTKPQQKQKLNSSDYISK